MFYNFCPGALEENCGAPKRIDVTPTEQVQTVSGLTYND